MAVFEQCEHVMMLGLVQERSESVTEFTSPKRECQSESAKLIWHSRFLAQAFDENHLMPQKKARMPDCQRNTYFPTSSTKYNLHLNHASHCQLTIMFADCHFGSFNGAKG